MYYNQNNYAHVPYPAPGYEKATVKSGGCGVCCAAMVVEGLTGGSFPPEQAAAFAIKSGARVSGGTDFRVLGKALAKAYGLTLTCSSDAAELTAHLCRGGWAVVNVGGDRAGHIGVFSNAGHYIVARGMEGGSIVLWDPGNYSGKYRRAGREGVTVRGNDLLAAPALVDGDAANRSPRYYLFAKKEETAAEKKLDAPSPWAAEAWQLAIQAGLLDGTAPQQFLTREQLAVVLQRLGLLKK